MATEGKSNKVSNMNLTARLKHAMYANEVEDSYQLSGVGAEVKAKSTTPDKNSFHRAISPVLVIAQCFAVLPVEGVTGPDAASLRFRWRRLRVLYTMLSLIGSMFLMAMFVINIAKSKVPASLGETTVCVYEVIDALGLILFLRLATKWPKLLRKVQRLEHEMNSNYGYPKSLAMEFKIITSTVLISSLVEHVLSNVKSINWSLDCTDWTIAWVDNFMRNSYAGMSVTGYSLTLAVFMRLTVNVNVFTWNFMDLLIILFSRFLTIRMRQINQRMKSVKGKVMPDHFWRQIREDYNSVSVLVKVVDDHISMIVLLSFGNNLFFICVQLLNSIQKDMSNEDFLYFYVSFIHLVLRSTTMCLFAASIHEESKEPRSTLFSVPSDCYSQEVQRFILQVTTDDVALTGLNFFSITKTLLLTLAGTIVTYEIVLVQLNSSSHSADVVVTNATHTINPYCPNHTSTVRSD